MEITYHYIITLCFVIVIVVVPDIQDAFLPLVIASTHTHCHTSFTIYHIYGEKNHSQYLEFWRKVVKLVIELCIFP